MDVTTVLVVGCGYIGFPLACLAKAACRTVFVTTRKQDRFTLFKKLGFFPVLWDVTTGLVSRASETPFPEVDAVVYSVGFDRTSGKAIEDVYVQGLSSTLEALPNVPKVVYASSTGVYGDAAGAWIDERSLPEPSDPSGVACRKAEETLKDYAALKRLEYCVLRFGGIYGPGRLLNSEPLKKGEPIPADGAAWLNLIHQDDAAMALWKAILYGESGEHFNIADGHPVRRQEFYLKLAELLNAPPPKFAPELARRQRGNRRINADKARWKLGWSPRYPSYVEGLEAIVRAEASSGAPGAD